MQVVKGGKGAPQSGCQRPDCWQLLPAALAPQGCRGLGPLRLSLPPCPVPLCGPWCPHPWETARESLWAL